MTALKDANRTPEFTSRLGQALDRSGFVSALVTLEDEKERPLGRRRPATDEPEPFGSIALLEDDEGVLRWAGWREIPVVTGRRAGTAVPARPRGRILEQRKFMTLDASRIVSIWQSLDKRLNGFIGDEGFALRELRNGTLVPAGGPLQGSEKERLLVVIHGTFSSSAHYFDPTYSPIWWQFLTSPPRPYNRIVAFDHGTLAMSPFVNAIMLNQFLADWKGDIDVVSHSRGGLVARWWLEIVRPGSSRMPRAVLVGSPLAGTGLASPARLRATVDLLTNLARTLSNIATLASLAVPLFEAIATILSVLGSVGALASRLPVLDAGVAMIPGLAAQSRVGNNTELLALRSAQGHRASYHAVKSNFEPANGLWGFWKTFRLANWAADRVFYGPNDLVVDTDSMDDFRDGLRIPASQCLDFGTSETVHHCNYFQQESTVAFIRKVLS